MRTSIYAESGKFISKIYVKVWLGNRKIKEDHNDRLKKKTFLNDSKLICDFIRTIVKSKYRTNNLLTKTNHLKNISIILAVLRKITSKMCINKATTRSKMYPFGMIQFRRCESGKFQIFRKGLTLHDH